MAKINGVEVKAVKSFIGHEGPCYQGNIYKNGKKLGFWSQDSWGGPDVFEFDESLLDEPFESFKDSFPESYMNKDYIEKGSFIHDILTLKDIEKDCKKEFKKGFKAVFFITDLYHFSWLPLPEVMTAEEVRSSWPDQVKDMESAMFKSGFNEMIFTADSFDILMDKEHTALPIFILK